MKPLKASSIPNKRQKIEAKNYSATHYTEDSTIQCYTLTSYTEDCGWPCYGMYCQLNHKDVWHWQWATESHWHPGQAGAVSLLFILISNIHIWIWKRIMRDGQLSELMCPEARWVRERGISFGRSWVVCHQILCKGSGKVLMMGDLSARKGNVAVVGITGGMGYTPMWTKIVKSMQSCVPKKAWWLGIQYLV